MVAGLRFWNLIWYAILLLGVVGLVPSIYWGRRTHWKNLDEVSRAVGTILVSVGMLILLNRVAPTLGQLLLILALVCFIFAFVFGRRSGGRNGGGSDGNDEDEDEDEDRRPEGA